MVTPYYCPPPYDAGQRAANALADELVTITGKRIEAEVLADWLRRRWHIISPLAHTIHGARDKPPATATAQAAEPIGEKE